MAIAASRKNRWPLVAAITILITGGWYVLTHGGERTRLLLWHVTRPATQAATAVSDIVRRHGGVFSSARDLQETIDRLEEENARLQAETARLQSVAAENETLRREAGLPQPTAVAGLPRIEADVTGIALTGRQTSVAANRGTRDGVAVGMPVMTPTGALVGTVTAADATLAEVTLLTHPDSVVRAQTSRDRTSGIVRGDAGLGTRLTLADRSLPLMAGDALVTVANGAMPGGLLVGTVAEVRSTADMLFHDAVVVPAYTPDTLRRVVILGIPSPQ